MVETSHDIGILIELVEFRERFKSWVETFGIGIRRIQSGQKMFECEYQLGRKNNSVIVSHFALRSVSLVFQGTSASGSSSPARSFASLRPQMTWRQNWHKPLLQLHRGRCPQEGHTSALTSANFGSPGITVWGW